MKLFLNEIDGRYNVELELYFSVWNWNYWYGVRWLSTTIERTNIHRRTIIPGILGVQLSMDVQLSLGEELLLD